MKGSKYKFVILDTLRCYLSKIELLLFSGIPKANVYTHSVMIIEQPIVT